jgi:hypothetical protein
MTRFTWIGLAMTVATELAAMSCLCAANWDDSPTPLPAKPGYARGKVLMTNGKPITAPTAKITIAIHGVSSKRGERMEYAPKVQADGTFEQKLVNGTYKFFAAQVSAPFNGKAYLLPLEAIGDDKSDQDSEKGIVQNYVWKITGARPTSDGNESNHTNWYGASVTMKFDGYRNDLRKSAPRPTAGAKCEFTLTPKGKIIDGSDGKELKFTREYDSFGAISLPDLPIGIYTVKGVETGPNGSKTPLFIRDGSGKYGDSTEVQFEPNAGSSAWPKTVNFTRPAN